MKMIFGCLLVFALCGCGPSSEEQRATEKLLIQYEKEQSQRHQELEKQWSTATDEQRLSWLSKCKSEILDHVNEHNSSYPGFFVDVYSADLYQIAVMQNGYRVDRADELKRRIAEYHERAEKDPMKAGMDGIDTNFVVVQRVPLEGKPNNFLVSSYRCDMVEDFGVRVI